MQTQITESSLVPMRLAAKIQETPDIEQKLLNAGLLPGHLKRLTTIPCENSIIGMWMSKIEQYAGINIQQILFEEVRLALLAIEPYKHLAPSEERFDEYFRGLRRRAENYGLAKLNVSIGSRPGLSPRSWLRPDRVKFPATIYQLFLLDHYMKTCEDRFPVMEVAERKPDATSQKTQPQPVRVTTDRNQVVSHLMALRAIVSLIEANADLLTITDGERSQILALIGKLLRVSQIDEAALKRLRSRVPADLARQITHILTPPSGGKESL